MTLARTALRLAVVNALENATMAAGRVYDSRISDFAPESFIDDAKATVIVLTDKDEGPALSEQDGGPPFRRAVDVVIEFGMVLAINEAEEGQPADYALIYPDTDAKLEAALDFLEFQMMRRLGSDPADAPSLFRSFTRIRKYDCHRQVTDDMGVKIAARVLTLTTEISDDQEQVYLSSDTMPVGADVLPEPMRSVCLAMPEGSPGASVCAAMIAAIAPLVAARLQGVDFVYSLEANAPDIRQTLEFPEEP